MVRNSWKTLPVLAAVLLLALVACQSETSTGDGDVLMDWSRLDAPNDYQYRMMDSTQTYGDMQQSVRMTELDGRDVYEITYLVEGQMTSENKLYFDADSGDPIKLVATQRMRDMEASTTVTYEDGQVVRIVQSPAAPTPDTSTTEIPPNTRDWMQVGFFLQATDLSEMDTLRVPFYQGFGRAFVDTAVMVNQGVESLEVPAGTFDAYHVNIQYAGAEADFYLQKGDDQRVLKHQIPGRQGPLMTVLLPDTANAEG